MPVKQTSRSSTNTDSYKEGEYNDDQTELWNIANALYFIGTAMKSVSREIRDLGNGNASTPMGAIEGHAVKVVEGAERVASALEQVAEALSKGD